MSIEWLTINIVPPKLDVSIVARGSDKFGLGASKELFEFDSKVFSQDEAIMHLESHSYIEWLELPK